MPTITSATITTLVTGTPGKAPASLLAIGEPGVDFQTLLGATAAVAPPMIGEPVTADQPARQPVAADGTALPLEAPVAAAVPVADAPAAIIAKLALPAMVTPPIKEPAPPIQDKIVPSLAAVLAPVPRQQQIASTKVSPPKREADPTGEGDEAETPADPSALPLAAPLVAIIQPPPLPMPTERGIKTSPLPLISVARTAPAARPIIAAAIPQTTRDIRWDGALPGVTPLAAPPALPVVQPLPIEAAPPLAARAATPAVATKTAPIAVLQSARPETAVPAPVAVPPVAAPVVLPAAIVVGPALQVFGAAISAAARHERGEAAADPLASLGAITAPAPIAAPVTVSDQPSLDIRQERWPQAMIAHIEALRDKADAGDTRIRLIPDALGTIDVSVTRDHDTVHVQFSAEQATTRTLIQEAQPRLAALAEERGLRLGQTMVDASAAGATSQQQQRQPQRDAALPSAPRRATQPHDDQDPADDGRVA